MIRRVVAPNPAVPPGPAPAPERLWSTEDAFAYCERMAREHAENFPVASRFVPAHLRPYVWAIYAFARSADDYADEPRYAGRRHDLLDDWEARLEAAYHGDADHPVFVALRDTVERRDIPISPLRDLLTAFRMDLATARYPTFETLRNYCTHSAHPVGRLVLYVFDYRDADLQRFSDDLCFGLQLANFLQDVGRDLARGRIYLPGEDLAHFGVGEADLAEGRVTPAFRDLMRFQVARARSYFLRGRPLLDKVGRDLGFELHLIWHGGWTILDKIEAVGYDVFRRRPSLSGADKLGMVARSAARRWSILAPSRE
jgi:hydroxysqualene synthase